MRCKFIVKTGQRLSGQLVFYKFKEIYFFPKEAAVTFLEATLKCIADSNYDSSVIDQIMQGKYIEDDKTVNALICACVATGFGYPDGKVNVEKIMKESVPTRQDLRPFIEDCNRESGKTPAQTFRGIVKCYREKLPVQLRFSN
ncbi:hypothetical protein O3G_MSEX014994 [Manduca sexta]|uniref:Uncharacterized protein n=1 Tax=Manduca sexta TaxID=7130 RepID=A0A921ZZZ9_MANSE|nr:hypothetical protein O3G_MSEX014994 [Manduca sexta]